LLDMKEMSPFAFLVSIDIPEVLMKLLDIN
jgi:hypothetical protein